MAAKKKAAKKKVTKKKTTKKATKAPAGVTEAEAKSEESAAPEKAKAAKTKVTSMSVNLGHVFALRPRVSTTFRQPDFLTARHMLKDESFATVSEAARAVAEKALELTHDGPRGRRERR